MEGNNGKVMRESLVEVYNTLEKLQPYSLHINDISVRRAFNGMLCHAKNAIDAALSAPPRNCDIGAPEEQGSRCLAQIGKWRGTGSRLIDSIMKWVQESYMEEAEDVS